MVTVSLRPYHKGLTLEDPLVAGGYLAPVDKDSPSSSRRAYKLTRKGKEAAQW